MTAVPKTLTPEQIEAKLIREERRVAFVRMAELMYGPRFGVQLSEALGVSQGLVSHIVVGRRALTDDVEDKLHAAAFKLGVDLQRRSIDLATEIGLAKKARRHRLERAQELEAHLEPDDPAPTMTP